MKSRTKLFAILIAVGTLIPTGLVAQYNKCAAKNIVTETVEETYINEETGIEEVRRVEKEVASDGFGNAQGNQYDLAVDLSLIHI